MNEEQKQLLEEATAKKNKFFIFETNTRYDVVITNFEMVKLEKPDQYGRDLQFKAKVLYEGGESEVNQSSSRFIAAIKPFIVDKEPTDLVALSIKKIGEGADTQYDIEERTE